MALDGNWPSLWGQICCYTFWLVGFVGGYPLFGIAGIALGEAVGTKGGIGVLIMAGILAGFAILVASCLIGYSAVSDSIPEKFKELMLVFLGVFFCTAVMGSYPLWGLAVPALGDAFDSGYGLGFLVMVGILTAFAGLITALYWWWNDWGEDKMPDFWKTCCYAHLMGFFGVAFILGYVIFGVITPAISASTEPEYDIEVMNSTDPTCNYGCALFFVLASLCGCIGLCACCFSYSSETPDIKDDWFKCWLHICPWPLVNHNPNRQRTINTYNNNNNNAAATPTTNTGGFDAVVTSGGGGGGDAGAASIRLRGAALEMQILADAERAEIGGVDDNGGVHDVPDYEDALKMRKDLFAKPGAGAGGSGGGPGPVLTPATLPPDEDLPTYDDAVAL